MAKEDFKARGAKDDHAARCFMQIVVDRYYLPPDTDVFVFFCLLKNPKNSQNIFCIRDSYIQKWTLGVLALLNTQRE